MQVAKLQVVYNYMDVSLNSVVFDAGRCFRVQAGASGGVSFYVGDQKEMSWQKPPASIILRTCLNILSSAA